MPNLLLLCVILLPTIAGSYLLFASAERLYASISWMRLPVPAKGTRLYKLLLGLWRMMGVVGLLFALALLTFAFWPVDYPVVTITNHSSVTLSNVVVSGNGFSERIDSIAAGTERKITVHPDGNSGLELAFDAHGQHIDTASLAYIEARGGYRVAVTVEPDLKVSVVDSDLRGPYSPAAVAERGR